MRFVASSSSPRTSPRFRVCERCSSEERRTDSPDFGGSSREEAAELEPNVRCVAAVHVPEEGIADYHGVVIDAGSGDREGGRHGSHGRWCVEDRSRTTADGASRRPPGISVRARSSIVPASTRIASPGWPVRSPDCRIVPFRGEYFFIRPGTSRHRAQSRLSGSGSGVPIPRRSLHAHGSRRARGGPERGSRHPTRGLSPPRHFPARSHRGVAYSGLRRFIARYPQADVRGDSALPQCVRLLPLAAAARAEYRTPGFAAWNGRRSCAGPSSRRIARRRFSHH